MTEDEKTAEAIRLYQLDQGYRTIATAIGETRHWVRRKLDRWKIEQRHADTPDIEADGLNVVAVPLAEISPNPNSRALQEKSVAVLAESIREIGLLEPVVLRRVGEGFEIIAGRHRVEAFRKLEREAIPALIREATDLVAELMLIDENLCRNEFSPAERAMAIGRRKAIYLQLHPETEHGGDRRSSRQVGDLKEDGDARRFTEATSDATGIAERTIQRDASRGARLGNDSLRKVVGTSLDKGEELDALAKLSEPKREELIERAAAGEQVTAKTAVKAEIRAARESHLGDMQAAANLKLPEARFGVILADPEWRFEPWSRESGMDRAADNHYPTSVTEVIAARPVQDIAAKDCALFLWATAPMLPQALLVMAAWGFAYKTHRIWKKDRVGTGYWYRNQHELILLGTKGDIPAPAMGDQFSSILEAPVGEHSEKPDAIMDMIEDYFPTLPKIELNARRARPGWTAWGLDAPQIDPETGEVKDAAWSIAEKAEAAE